MFFRGAGGARIQSRMKVCRGTTGLVWQQDALLLHHQGPLVPCMHACIYLRKEKKCTHSHACRPYKVLRHVVGRPASEDVVVHEESDDSFYVGIHKSRSEQVMFISCGESVEGGGRPSHSLARTGRVGCHAAHPARRPWIYVPKPCPLNPAP